MPQQVLGIALEDNHVAMVRLTGHGKAYDVTLALRQPLPVHDDADEQAELRRETMQQLVETHGLRGDTVLAARPAHHAVLRNLTLPFRDQRRLRQMMTFALDEHMPFEPEDVVVDFAPAGAAGAAADAGAGGGDAQAGDCRHPGAAQGRRRSPACSTLTCSAWPAPPSWAAKTCRARPPSCPYSRDERC